MKIYKNYAAVLQANLPEETTKNDYRNVGRTWQVVYNNPNTSRLAKKDTK